MQKGRQTAHVAVPYWMRDTCYGLTPPPNFEAEIFRQILLAGSAANRIYPMRWQWACPCERAGQGAWPGSGPWPRLVSSVERDTLLHRSAEHKQRSMCRCVTRGHTHPAIGARSPPYYSPHSHRRYYGCPHFGGWILFFCRIYGMCYDIHDKYSRWRLNVETACEFKQIFAKRVYLQTFQIVRALWWLSLKNHMLLNIARLLQCNY